MESDWPFGQWAFGLPKALGTWDESGNVIAAKANEFSFGIGLAPKETVATWARFPAPPSDVAKMTVYLPGARRSRMFR